MDSMASFGFLMCSEPVVENREPCENQNKRAEKNCYE